MLLAEHQHQLVESRGQSDGQLDWVAVGCGGGEAVEGIVENCAVSLGGRVG